MSTDLQFEADTSAVEPPEPEKLSTRREIKKISERQAFFSCGTARDRQKDLRDDARRGGLSVRNSAACRLSQNCRYLGAVRSGNYFDNGKRRVYGHSPRKCQKHF